MYSNPCSSCAPVGPVGLGLWTPDVDDDETQLERTLSENVDAARAYLRDRWADFLTLGPRIIDLQHRAAELAYRVGQEGDLERKRELQAIIRALGRLNVAYGKAVDRFELERVGEALGLAGYPQLGAVPVAGLTVFSGLALVVVWAFRSYSIQERKLDMIEAGYDATAIAAVGDAGPSPTAFLGGIGELGKLALWGGLAWLALQAYQTFKANPPLEILYLNPPEGEPIGRRVYDLTYRHDEDGQDYIHEFGPSVALEALDDGSVRLYHVNDRPVWAEFEVE